MGYLPAGRHHFEIKEVRLEARGPTFFAGDGEIAAGAITVLYLFGRGDAVEGRFISLPAVVAPGMPHVNLINLIAHRPEPRGGELRGREPLRAGVGAARAR